LTVRVVIRRIKFFYGILLTLAAHHFPLHSSHLPSFQPKIHFMSWKLGCTMTRDREKLG
jgi:hypothetical protein